MKTEELNFIGNDPGTAKFGNFINYYSFHSAEQRTNNLDPQMFPRPKANQEVICMDIGCNTGELSKDLYLYMNKIYPNYKIKMLAVDIDSTLIARALEANHNHSITFQTANAMEESGCKSIKNYLKSVDQKEFDVVFCFSVTMWIHINNGDEGLHKFLNFLKSISRTIIIEPQPWNCYRNAQRRMKKSGSLFPLYETLQIRSDVYHVIEKILSENTHKKVYESSNSKWNRKIQSFHKVSTIIS